jgi:hypothetical protein
VTFFIQGLPMPSIKLGGEVLEIIDPMNIQPVSADQSPNVIAAGLLAVLILHVQISRKATVTAGPWLRPL